MAVIQEFPLLRHKRDLQSLPFPYRPSCVPDMNYPSFPGSGRSADPPASSLSSDVFRIQR